MSSERENNIRGLTREGLQYREAGMLDRLSLVNEQLLILGAHEVARGDAEPVRKQTRQSTQAATRQKRSAG